MALTANQLKPQVDLPVWEWLRFCPTAAVTGVSMSCIADNSNFNYTSGRYIYYFATSAAFYRYDTITDTWEQLTSPPNAIILPSSMRFAGAQGYYNRVISAGASTLTSGMPFGRSAVGFNVRILSGKGAGQERVITDITDPIVADVGNATGGAVGSITDTAKAWQDSVSIVTLSSTGNSAAGGTTYTVSSTAGLVPGMLITYTVGNGTGSVAAATTITSITNATTFVASAIATFTSGTTSTLVFTIANLNKWVGYTARVLFGTGPTQTRKILYNSATVLTVSDQNYQAVDPWGSTPFPTAPAAGSVYHIESSTITVDTPWDIQPDNTSRFVIQSGGIYVLSGAAAPFYTLQYYDILSDIWYCKPTVTNMISITGTDASLEKQTENSTIWDQGIATAGNTTTLTDTTNNWAVNQWAGYTLFIFSGTGRGQITTITSNTATVLTVPTLGTGLDATSRYRIKGFDGGSATSATYNTLTDSSKTWVTTNSGRWANYGVRIVAGTGIGQLRQISSNTATTLTTYQSWNIQPDSTSKYVIQGFSDALYFSWGALAEIYIHQAGDIDQLSHGRVVDTGVASIACAMLCDSNHTIYEQPQVALSAIGTGAANVVATTATNINHNFKVGQYVSIRGILSSGTAADVYNGTGLFQITSVPSTTTFTYTPVATIGGAITLLTALGTTALTDASKYYADNATGGSTTSVTFAKATPSNINGWWITGTNVGAAAGIPVQITSGAGTTSLVIGTGTGTPTGVMQITKYPVAVTGTYSSGGTVGLYTVTITGTAATAGLNLAGWYMTGANIGLGCTCVSSTTGAIVMSVPATATMSGTVTFSYGPSGSYCNMNSTAPTVTTGSSTGQGATIAGNTLATFTPILTLAAAPLAGITRYVIAKPTLIGAQMDQSPITYLAGISTVAGSTTTLVDANAFVAGAPTGTGNVGTNTITLSVACPANCTGWYVSGTGVALGARIVSGANSTTITTDLYHTGPVSGVMAICAWGTSGQVSPLVGRRLKIVSGATGLNQEVLITAVAPATGTITFGIVVAPVIASTYSLLSIPVKGAGHELNWVYGNSYAANKGKYFIMNRGGAVTGFDKIDNTTDRVIVSYTSPNSAVANLTTGTMAAYDGQDRMYYTKDLTNLCYYLDVNTFMIHGAGMFPYAVGGACLGNRMEIFQTADGLKYLWLVRQLQVETFRSLLFY